MKQLLSVCMLLSVVLWSCSNDDGDERTPVNYQLTVGDTVIVIPDSAVTFADLQFSFDAYMLREYQVATDEDISRPGEPFWGNLNDWKAQGWGLRTTYLVSPFVHNVTTTDKAQYYYMIGTYLDQFGFGWRDTFDPNANLFNPAVNIWLEPADTTLIPDNAATVLFDGETRLMGQYRGMWQVE